MKLKLKMGKSFCLFPAMLLMAAGGAYALFHAPDTIRQPPGAPVGEKVSSSRASSRPPRWRRNSVGMEFVLIPAGTFDMGSNAVADERPVHRVRITASFYIGKYEVTQRQWRQVVGTTIRKQRDKKNPEWPLRGEGADHPMYYVTWDEAQAFIRRLNGREHTDRYRLPTEAEWEYACRAGTSGAYAGALRSMGWYEDNAGAHAHPVGRKHPNAWGVFDMHGNVLEWCRDWYGAYSAAPAIDPQGPASGTERVVRGGSWALDAGGSRSAARTLGRPDARNSSLGFRVVEEVE